jgi:hypothetical protein
MGQSWKTLLLVVIGAAAVGWVTVRLLGSRGREPVGVQTAAIASPEAPAPTAAVEITPPPRSPPSPAAAAPTAMVPPPPGDGDESDVIARELETLTQALVTDQRIADRVMPRVNDVLDIPSTVQYRRAPDFWQPALAPAEEENME